MLIFDFFLLYILFCVITVYCAHCFYVFSMYFIGVSGLRVLPLLINGWMDGVFERSLWWSMFTIVRSRDSKIVKASMVGR